MRTNEDWLKELRSVGASQQAALVDLRATILPGLRRALDGWVRTSGREFSALAEDFAQETLLKVLENLDSFQGRSQFTTWVHKISVRVALTELRRRRWKDVSLDSLVETGQTSAVMDHSAASPSMRATQAMSMDFVRKLMAEELSDKQRTALTAVAMNGMPLDEVARRLGMTRNAVYKTIHDARLKLKRRLAREGMSVQAVVEEQGPG